MTLTVGNFGQQDGNALKLGALEHLAAGILDVLRPELMYPEFFPLASFDRNVARGMTDYSKPIEDWSGVASWRAQGSNDVPTVSTLSSKTSVPIFTGGVMNALDRKDIAQGNILTSRGFSTDPVIRAEQISLMATRYHKERVLFFGDQILDAGANEFYPGILNHPLIPQATVAVGTALATEFSTKTPDEILFDFTTMFSTLNASTNTIMLASDVWVPTSQFHILTDTKAGVRANDEVLITFLSEQNATMQLKGRKINIHRLRYLEGAGVGGSDRMIVLDNQPQYNMMAEPLDYTVYDVQKRGYQFEYWGEFERSPLHLPYPQYAAYWDGI